MGGIRRVSVINIKQNKLINLSNLLIHTIRENIDIKSYPKNIDNYAQDILSVLGLVCAHEIHSLEEIGEQDNSTRKRLEKFLVERMVYALSLKHSKK